MQTPETRIINQSTYTPIETRKDNFTPKQPYLKQNLLVTAFNDQQVGQLMLEHMAELQQPFAHFEQLSSAINKVWTGDIAGSVNLLRDLDLEEVVRFAREGLDAEKSLLDKARQDAQASITAVTERVQADAEANAKLRREMDSLRVSILSEVRSMVAPLTVERARPTRETTVPEVGSTEAAGTVPAVRVTAAPPTAEMILPVVTSEMLCADVAKATPRSATFLNAIGYFLPAPTLINIPVSQTALAARAMIVENKKRILETLVEKMKVEPIGYLHLERLQFTPVGYERGELVYSLPMLPGETVRLTHREWSRTETEYSKLVSTEIETAAEEAISEKSEITQSSNTQQQHSSAYNASVNAGYSGAGFNISSSFGYNCNNSESSSRQSASKRAQDITKKASSRAKKDSKITFKVTTAYELEEQSYREIKNDLGRAVRWDFHRLMKRWRIDLYRYDVRLTYDIVIPEPGSYLLRKYIQLKQLEDELAKPNPFNLSPANIVREYTAPSTLYVNALPTAPSTAHVKAPPVSDDRTPASPSTPMSPSSQGLTTWVALAQQYRVSLDPPPSETIELSIPGVATYSERQKSGIDQLILELPSGYEFYSWQVKGSTESPLNEEVILGKPSVGKGPLYQLQEQYGSQSLFIYENPVYDKANVDDYKGSQWGLVDPLLIYNSSRLNSGMKRSSRFAWMYQYRWSSPRHFHGVHGEDNDIAPNEGTTINFHIDVTAKLTEQTFKEWQMQCYERLVDAARLQYENKQDSLKKQREALLAELNREDALMLRKIEKEELMKGVLRWLVGPRFSFYPKDMLTLPSVDENGNLQFYDESTQSVKTEYWLSTLQYGELIKFLHQAIEWENVNYVLYPYFWTYPDKDRLDFKQFLYHADYVHRSFLRAGAARVVLTVRPSFEKDFLSFMEGQLDTLLEGNHQYMTVADELKAMAMTKYPYTQDANVEKEEYIFTWEKVGENGLENERLLYYLEHDLSINWAYLFSTGLDFASDLDKKTVSKKLRDEFGKHNKPLTPQAQVEVNKAKINWTITDEGNTKYSIRNDGQMLNVFDWANRPKLEKSDDDNTICITQGNDSVEITKDDQKGTAVLKASNSRTYDLIIKEEGGQHKVYKEQNWVDTWYEFTPTGALDVVEGVVLA